MFPSSQALASSPLMAQPTTENHTINSYFVHWGDNFNVIFISRVTCQSDHHTNKMSSRQAIYAFIVTVLLNFVQIKYQGKVESPFQTHPKTMFLGIASLLLYCVGLRRTDPASAVYSGFSSKISLRFCGPLSLAAIISVLLPASLCPFLFSASVLFTFSQSLPASQVGKIWKVVTKVAIYVMEKFISQPHHRSKRRGRRGGVHVQLTWLSQQVYALSDQEQILPL